MGEQRQWDHESFEIEFLGPHYVGHSALTREGNRLDKTLARVATPARYRNAHRNDSTVGVDELGLAIIATTMAIPIAPESCRAVCETAFATLKCVE